ncbi:helix-turn-helix transcriptional regulator [Nonomuraea wenchangensis]|uniref:helix-turn-helix domain-containing protein n=1 Tax=Nonomuraea wenchangensis TaxID=568860 RepID=UPI003433586F
MGRPESPITGDGPVAELARALRELRARAGRTYRDMAEDPACLSRFSLLAEAARGRACPTWRVLEDFVTACGERPADWRELWERAHRTPRRRATARQTSTARGNPAAAPAPVQRPAPSTPDPWQANSAKEFVLALRELRAWSGQRSFYGVAAAMGTRLAKSTLYDALNPNREHMPPLEIVRAVVVACHADVETWTQAWQRLRLEEHHQAPLPTRSSVSRRAAFLPPGRDPAAYGQRPLRGLVGGLAKSSTGETQGSKSPDEAALDAVLEDFERLRTSRSYPTPIATRLERDPDGRDGPLDVPAAKGRRLLRGIGRPRDGVLPVSDRLAGL